ncbi:hypothetical protein [Sphingorhabdus sp. 109]|uniref:hypothetical protein n=1 Tax=Sphingorhabdus sp. 109 TaxID=2653173 RepID=UPI0012F1A797|nr:hypothetical protein [Sphingorhabdus sp. 109]VWX58345.1 conserved hypothetical protein [Sphingorhabdus sp. 109]
MRWTYSKFVEPELKLSAFKLQPIVIAALGSGPLTAALLNLTVVALITMAREYLPEFLCLRPEHPCNG